MFIAEDARAFGKGYGRVEYCYTFQMSEFGRQVQFEFFLRLRTLMVSLLLSEASISIWSLLTAKNARLSPENIADCVRHRNIPIQT